MKKLLILLMTLGLIVTCTIIFIGCDNNEMTSVQKNQYIKFYDSISDFKADIGDKYQLPKESENIVEIFAVYEEKNADENLVKRTETEMLFAHITYKVGGYTTRVSYFCGHRATDISAPEIGYIYCRREYDDVYIGKSAIRETPNERSNSRFITQEFGAGYNFTLCQVNTEIPKGEEVTAEKIAYIKEYTREIIAGILN